MVRTSGQEGSEGSGEFRILLEQIRSEVHVVADGHKTINQKLDRIETELKGEIHRLDGRVDFYMRELRKELTERMDVGFTENRTSIAALVSRFDAHEQAHLN